MVLDPTSIKDTLMEQNRQLLNRNIANTMHGHLQPQTMIGLKKVTEYRWVKVIIEKELAAASVKDCLSLCATPVGGEFRLVRSGAIEMEISLLADSNDWTVELNASRFSLSGRTRMYLV